MMMDGDPVELAVVNVNTLTRWCNTYVPGYAQMSDNPSTPLRKSPFPFDPDLNSKISYWVGDVTLLNAQAIVCCNNEALIDNDPLTVLTVQRAGPNLTRELRDTIKFCRTGEAKITKAYQLPARHIIHTVGPRFNIKYRTAAENALFNCYRNVMLTLREHNLTSVGLRCIHTLRRCYPSLDGAHIALRTVRRFLEKVPPGSIDLVVFVVTGDDRESYNSLLPLYFPRSSQEELYAGQRLPLDVGNEFGEPVVAERQIRIAANPARPTVLKATDSNNETSGAGADDADDSDDDDGANLREIFNSSISIGEHAFSKMEADVDKRRKGGVRMATNSGDAEEQLPVISPVIDQKTFYERTLRRARQENFNDLHSLRFLYQSGFDKHGRPVVVFIGRNFQGQRISRDKAVMYFVSQLDSLVNNKYVFVYVHTLTNDQSTPSTDCLKYLYQVTDDRYKSNLEALYMLHADIWVKMSFWWLSTFSCPEFKSRIQYLPGVENLFARISLDQLDLPEFVLQFDYQTNGTRYFNEPEDEQQHTRNDGL